MRFERRNTAEGRPYYDGVNFGERIIRPSMRDGSVPEPIRVVVPDSWGATAAEMLATKYLRRAQVPSEVCRVPEAGLPEWAWKSVPSGDATFGPEHDCLQVFNRIAGSYAYYGWKAGYFDSHADALTFYDEIAWMLLHQKAAPNSPTFFNLGLWWAYGIAGEASGGWRFDADGSLHQCPDSYSNPQTSACFIQTLEDTLLGENGITSFVEREARVFRGGSGSGANFSNLRGKNEPLSGGGKSSGSKSWLEIFDRNAGGIKSGGINRRAAKMAIMDDDHPDVEEFINWKNQEEFKVASIVTGAKVIQRHVTAVLKAFHSGDEGKLARVRKAARRDGVPENVIVDALHMGRSGAGDVKLPKYDTDYEGEAYQTVGGQNANNSISLTNAFMRAVEDDGDWFLKSRTGKVPDKKVVARKIWRSIVHSAWACADPGTYFKDTINDWHTCKTDGEIVASNPCCHVGETLIWTTEGKVRIDRLAAMARNGTDLPEAYCSDAAGNTTTRKIIHAWNAGKADGLVHFTTAAGVVVSCTPGHQILTDRQVYVRADQVAIGDRLRGRDATVISTGFSFYLEAEVDVYDLEVEGVHNYAVASPEGDGTVIVSNCEYLFLDETACTLACLNLLRFFDAETGVFDAAGFRHASRLWTVALDISLGAGQYPSKGIAKGSHQYRTIGLGHCNVGSLIMASGLAYDSDDGRALAAAVTAIMHFESYRTSSEIAARLGAFPRFEANRECAMRVLRNHVRCVGIPGLGGDLVGVSTPPPMVLLSRHGDGTEIGRLADEARAAAIDMMELAEIHGLRNAQTSVCMPAGTVGLLMEADCFTGDTLVAVADGRNAVSLAELAAEGKDVDVYCSKDRKTTVRRMRNIRLIRENVQTVRVRLDDDSFIRCTPEHQFMLLDGQYRRADQLQPGDSLMRFDSVITDEKGSDRRKVWMGPAAGGNRSKGRSWTFQYRLSASRKFPGYTGRNGGLIHHLDFDSLNDRYCNLHKCKDVREHQRLHWDAMTADEKSSLMKGRLSKLSPEQLSERSKKANAARGAEGRRLVSLKAAAARSHEQRSKSSAEGWSNISSEDRAARSKKAWETRRAKIHNHKVVSVNPDGFENVYCGEVEEVHNFAVITSGGDDPRRGNLSGVVVHNCTGIEPDFSLVKHKKVVGGSYIKFVNTTIATALRRLGYKPKDVDAIVKAVDDTGTVETCDRLKAKHLPVFDCSNRCGPQSRRSIRPLAHVDMVAAVQPFLSGGISKCVTGDTIIQTSSGMKRIGTLHEGESPDSFRVIDLSVPKWDDLVAKASHFYYGGFREVWTVTLSDGRTVTGTAPHRLRTASEEGLGWRTLTELQVGEYVAIHRGADLWGQDEIPKSSWSCRPRRHKSFRIPSQDQAYDAALFLGMLTADGHVLKGDDATVGITKNCPEVLDKYEDLMRRLFGLNSHRVTDPRNGVTGSRVCSADLRDWLKDVGFSKRNVPDFVLGGSRRSAIAYLSGLYLDGWITENGGNVAISQKHRTILDDVQAIWDNLGVATYFCNNRVNGKDYPVLHVNSACRGYAAGLLEWLEPHKRERSVLCVNSEDRRPFPIKRRALESAIRDAHRTQEFRSCFDRRTFCLGKDLFFKAASACGLEIGVDESRYDYLQVVSVEHAGHREVYDLAVPETESFVGNGIVNHNTLGMPNDATEADVDEAFMYAWKSGVKAIPVYRDGSKLSQPLNSTRDAEDEAEGDEEAADKVVVRHAAGRRDLPSRRKGYTQKARIADHKFYVQTGEYQDGSLGEFFLTMHKEGAAFRAMANSLAMAVSIGLQHGVPLTEFVEAFCFTKFEPSGPVHGDDRIKNCTSLVDYVFRNLAVNYLGRDDLAHAPPETSPTTIAVGAVVAKPPGGDAVAEARSRGYEGDACRRCGEFTMVRDGRCLRCDSCGETSGGCS